MKYLLFLIYFFSYSINAMELKIATHNLAMKYDAPLFNLMSTRLHEMNLSPDILLVQEVVKDSAQKLESTFNMKGHFVKRPWDGEAVGILTHFKIIFTDSLTIKSRADNGFTRTAALIEFNHPSLGLVRAISTHFAYRLNHSHIREEQMNEVRNWINKHDKKRPANLNIIGGDFNAQIEERLFSHLEDYFNPNSKIITHFPTQRRIDYVFIKEKPVAQKSFHTKEIFPFPNGRIDGKELSDHKTTLFVLFRK